MTDIRKLCERVLSLEPDFTGPIDTKDLEQLTRFYAAINDLRTAAPLLAIECQKQRETIEKLREALQVYADHKTWRGLLLMRVTPTVAGASAIEVENGELARRVLEETK